VQSVCSLLLLRVSVAHLVLCKRWGEEASKVCFSHHIPSGGVALGAAQSDLPAGRSYSSRRSSSVQGAGPSAKCH